MTQAFVVDQELSETLGVEDEAGIFTWCLDTEKLYGDTTVASIFGLDPSRTVTGLPFDAYSGRIYDEDRSHVAALVSEAIRDGKPYRAEYRVLDNAGSPRWVVSFGRCFRDHAGNPRYYSGIVHAADELYGAP